MQQKGCSFKQFIPRNLGGFTATDLVFGNFGFDLLLFFLPSFRTKR